MVVFGVLTLPDAYAAVDFDVLVFLLGMMLIVGYLEVGKFFEWAARWVLRRVGTPERLLLGVVAGGGLLSAFFVNDTICLVVTPVLLAALGPLRVRPNAYLIGLAMGSNVGSVLSVTGNPQNMLVGIWSGATFGAFLVHMLPVALGGLAITYGYLRWAYRRELSEPFRERLEAVPVTLVLIASSFTCQMGVFAAERGDVFGLRRWYVLTFLMGLFFVLGQAYEYYHLMSHGTTIPGSAYGTVFYLATGFHGLHVTGGVIYLLSILRVVAKRREPAASYNAVEIAGLYWHFVDLVWIMVFTFMYLL